MISDAYILFSSRKVICQVSEAVKCLILINSQKQCFSAGNYLFPVFLVKEKFALIVQELLILEKKSRIVLVIVYY